LGNTNLSSTIVETAPGAGIDVAMTSLDDFIRSHSARGPTLVMIDVEGAEIEVLRGMRETVLRHRPVIMCEVHWINDAFFSYCAEHLAPVGYTVRPLAGGEFPAEPSRFHALLLPGPPPEPGLPVGGGGKD
jgi:hypothetical protein